MAAGKPVLVELDVFHENCFAIPVTERMDGVSMVSVPANKRTPDRITFYARISGPGAPQAVERMRKQAGIRRIDLLCRGKEHVFVYAEADPVCSSLYSCLEAGALLNEPALTIGTHDTLSLIFPDQDALKRFDSERPGFDFRLRSKKPFDEESLSGLATFSKQGFTQLKTVSSSLSPAQREAFDLAVQRGYYHEPQKITVTELAFETGVSASTCAEHLRKAEAKLMPVLGQLMKYL